MAKGRQRTDYGTANDYFAVTPNDAADLPVEAAALVLAVGGDVVVTKPNGDTATLTLPAGQFNGRVVRVWATGTTATGITALV